MAQLEEEGAVQILRYRHLADQAPLLAGVGPMQFELAVYRLEHEFGASVELSEVPYRLARRLDAAGARMLEGFRGADVVVRSDGTLLALFASEFHLVRFESENSAVRLDPIVVG